MKIRQTIEREYPHLVLTLTEYPSGKILATRTWENAAQYTDYEDDENFHLVVPKSKGINIKPGETCDPS